MKRHEERVGGGLNGHTGWRVRLSSGRAVPTPAVAGGRVFVGGGFGSHEFYALDAKTGERLWELRTSDDGPTCAVVSDEYVAFNTESCTLEVVEAATGREVWRKWLGDPLLAQPALAGSRVFMVYPRAGGHWLGAFRIEDGTPLWELEIGHDVITAPIFAERALYLATFDGHVHCVEPRTGERLWSRVVRATSAPWIHGGEIYVAQREEEEPVAAGVRGHGPHAGSPAEACHVYTRDAGIARRRYQSKLAPYLSADWGAVRKSAAAREDAHVGFVQAPAAAKLGSISSLIGERGVYRAWRFQGSRPVVVDGVLYETTGDRLEARDLATVELLWNWQDAGALEGERRLTPPAVASRRVLAGTWDGRLLVWSADTGALIHEVNVGSPCHWQPVMSDGWIYAGLEDGTLVGADVQDLHCDGWPMWGGGPGHNGMQPAQEAERT